MAAFKMEDYAPVEDRLVAYKKDYPDYRVETNLIQYEIDGEVVVLARLFQNKEDQEKGLFHSTGIASEVPEGYVNKTSRVENCETSAIGRALANAGYQGKKRPSQEEMKKVERLNAKPEKVVEPTPASSDTPPEPKEETYESIIASFEKKSDLQAWYSTVTDELSKNPEARKSFTDKYKKIVQDKLVSLKS